MPKITILGSCQQQPYTILAIPNPQKNKKGETITNTDKGYKQASEIFYPAIEQSDLIIVITKPDGTIGKHTRQDMLKAIQERKRIIIIKPDGVTEI